MIIRVRNIRPRNLPTAAFWLATILSTHMPSYPAQARDGAPLNSPFEFHPNLLFNFSSPRLGGLTDPDCKLEKDAMPEFDALGLTTILKWPASNNFLEKAFVGKLGFVGRIANVDHLAVVDEGRDKFRLFLGSTKILSGQLIYCGFGDAQYLNGQWADAGFENKTLYEQLPEYTAWQLMVMKLSAAYNGMDYGRVRSSLLARGFTPVPQPQKPVDRCSPGFESVCFQFKEAACDPETGAGPACLFEWRSAESDSLVITADLQQVSGGNDEIGVTGAIELPPEQSDNGKANTGTAIDQSSTRSPEPNERSGDEARSRQPGEKSSSLALENARWHDDVTKHINDQAINFKIGESGTVSIGLDVSASGEISKVIVVESSGKTDLDATAVEMAKKVSRVPPPPSGQATHLSMKLSFL